MSGILRRFEDAVARPSMPHNETACPTCNRENCEGHGSPFVSADALMAEPKPVEVIEGIAYADRATVCVGESGGNKTFFVLAASASVSDGRAFMGRAVRQGSVAYVSFEGDALGLRLRALREAHGHRLEHLYFLRAAEPLSPVIDRDRAESPSSGELAVRSALGLLRADLVERDRPPLLLVIIDTIRASLTGSEDSSETVAAYLRAVRRLLACAPGAAAILTHHSGWLDGETKRKRERGSSALRGNVDVTLFLEHVEDADANEARLMLTTLKIRDAERPAPLYLTRRRVELAAAPSDDLRYGPATSCVIEADIRSRADRDAADLAKATAQTRDDDLKVLRAMLLAEPPATSIHALRLHSQIRTQNVTDAIGRITRAGWASQVKRGAPWTVTDTGRAALAGGSR